MKDIRIEYWIGCGSCGGCDGCDYGDVMAVGLREEYIYSLSTRRGTSTAILSLLSILPVP